MSRREKQAKELAKKEHEAHRQAEEYQKKRKEEYAKREEERIHREEERRHKEEDDKRHREEDRRRLHEESHRYRDEEDKRRYDQAAREAEQLYPHPPDLETREHAMKDTYLSKGAELEDEEYGEEVPSHHTFDEDDAYFGSYHHPEYVPDVDRGYHHEFVREDHYYHNEQQEA